MGKKVKVQVKVLVNDEEELSLLFYEENDSEIGTDEFIEWIVEDLEEGIRGRICAVKVETTRRKRQEAPDYPDYDLSSDEYLFGDDAG